MSRQISWVTVVVLVGLWAGRSALAAEAPSKGEPKQQDTPRQRVPIIYGTDLLHPHSDPDDHFDLATVFAMPELDVKAILLDRGDAQKSNSGRTPVEQMFRLTGRRVPYAAGLSERLKTPDDKGLDQPKEDQAAVELLLKTLRESPEPLIQFYTGSVRDVCAAFNREPELMREKTSRLYINMGHLEEKNDWNVNLDPQAYVGLMRSGLPIYWCPCLPNNVNRSTHWRFEHPEILEHVPPALLNWFIYALQRVPPDELDPIAALTMDLRPWRHLVMRMKRNMWCTGPLIHAAGRHIFRAGDRWIASASTPERGKLAEVFTFVPIRVEASDARRQPGKKISREAIVHAKWAENAPNPNMHLYKVTDPKNHEPALKSCLRDLLHQFPVVK